MSHAIREQGCPYCGYKCNRTDDVDGDAKPHAGDVSVCFRCTEISFFDSDLNLRRPFPIELENLQRLEPKLWQQIEQVRAAKRQITGRFN